MIFLGVPARLTYEAVGYQSGLKGIFCVIERPDMTCDGPFPMEEGLHYSAGAYFYNYITTQDDPEGRYRAMFISPQENNRRTSVRLEFCKRPLSLVEISTREPGETIINLPEQDTVEVEILSGFASTIESVASSLIDVIPGSADPEEVEVRDAGVLILQAIDEPTTTIEIRQ